MADFDTIVGRANEGEDDDEGDDYTADRIGDTDRSFVMDKFLGEDFQNFANHTPHHGDYENDDDLEQNMDRMSTGSERTLVSIYSFL